MRVALGLSVLVVLGVGAALYWGVMPMDLRGLRDAALSLTAPPPPPARPAIPPVPVVIATARVADVPIFLSGIGTVQAYNTVSVKSRVDGEITQVLFQEGQDVKAGDPLAIIDPRPFVAQLAQARATRGKDQATLDGAVLDLNRYANLVLKDFASRQQLDQQRAIVDSTRAQILADEAQISYAQTQLDFATIRSSITGRVGIRQIDLGNFVHAADNAPIVVITQLQPISVVFTLPAAAVAQSHLTLGMVHVPVLAYAADDTTKLDEGTVELVDNTVDSTTGTIKLKASFPNKDIRLWPGDFVNGRLVVETRKAAVTVPEPALRHGPRGDFVWIVRPNKTVISKGVTAGQAVGGRVLIEQGLEPGSEIVTGGHFRLDDNARVEILRDESAPAPPARAPAKPPG